MAFAVSQWPYSPDPRTALFSAQGWAFGAVAPWAWLLTSPGATGAYADLVEGVIVKPSEDLGFYTRWEGFSDTGLGTQYQFDKTSRGNVGNEEVSLDFALSFFNISEPNAGGNASAVWPEAISVLGPWEMLTTPGGNPIPDIPNGVSLTPAVWDVAYPV